MQELSIHKDVAGVILAGGKSSRMGQDKRFLTYQGNTFLELATANLEKLNLAQSLISANDLPGAIKDSTPDRGPVSGILSVVNHLDCKGLTGVIFIPVDTPRLTSDHLLTLVESGKALNKAVCYKDCYLPVYLPIWPNLKTLLEENLNFNNGAVKNLLATMQAEQLEPPHLSILKNINRPADLAGL